MTTLRFEPGLISLKMSREEAVALLDVGELQETCALPDGNRMSWSVRVDDGAKEIIYEGLSFTLPRAALVAEANTPTKLGLARYYDGTTLQVLVDLRRSK